MAGNEADLQIFGIEGDNDLRLEYPELAEIEEFKSLKAKEVRLAWYIGNRTSPIYKLSKRDKLSKSLELTYGKDYHVRKDLGEIINGQLPDYLINAIRKMESFNPEYRLRAKLMTQYMFEVLNEMIVLDSQTLASMDIDEKKKYTDLVVKVNDELPSMIKNLESAYGAKVIERKAKKQVLVKINDVLK
jgi:hypothetical protein